MLGNIFLKLPCSCCQFGSISIFHFNKFNNYCRRLSTTCATWLKCWSMLWQTMDIGKWNLGKIRLGKSQRGGQKWTNNIFTLFRSLIGRNCRQTSKPWNNRLDFLDRSSEIISDFLFSACTSANSVLMPLRSDFRSEIVLWACSKLDSANRKRFMRVDSISERRSESLFFPWLQKIQRVG